MKSELILSFEGGCLAVRQEGYGDQNGDGRLTFRDDDLDWDEGAESMVIVRSIRLPRSELEAIRDFLVKTLAATPTPARDA